MNTSANEQAFRKKFFKADQAVLIPATSSGQSNFIQMVAQRSEPVLEALKYRGNQTKLRLF
jgi:hypothetical protein